MKAVYAGSFDPFTNGHMDIVREASKIFETVYVVVATNPQKKRRVKKDLMVKIITECVSDYKNVEVVCWDDLIAEFCVENGVKYLVRGLRNTSDYLYEEEIAKINQEIAPKLRTMYLRATNDTISSSMVWE
jgi:pantetheine-phosphate adenylyltransferase